MRVHTETEKRTLYIAGTLFLTLGLLSAPGAPAVAQTGDEVGSVVTQLEGIRAELGSISQLLQTLEKHQQVTLLMTRIRLKQQRLSLLESQLREARNDQTNLEQELEHLETVEASYLTGLERDDFGTEDSEVMRGEIEFLRRQKTNVETRLEAQRAAVIELENVLGRAREDVLALEETVDEQLGLR